MSKKTRDPYQVLGLTKKASLADIKKAFRNLAKKYHPDQNPDNPKAKDLFNQITSAYELLSDKDKRAAFDRGDIDAEGNPTFNGFDFGGASAGQGRRSSGFGNSSGFNHEDIIKDIFGFGGASRGKRAHQQSADPFANADFMAGMSGRMHQNQQRRQSKGDDVETDLTLKIEDIAKAQKVAVTLPTGKTLRVQIPSDVEDGQIIRLKGQGQKAPIQGPAGDAKITLKILPHPVFKKDKNNLHRDVNISLDEAVLGSKIPVETLEGVVHLSVPAMTSSGRVLRLKGKGLPGKAKQKGDLYVKMQIILPEENDAALEALMKRWQKDAHYKVRDFF